MRLSQRQGLIGGLALLSCAAVALQIIFTRLATAMFGHSLAFLAASVPLLGAAAGGALCALIRSIAWPSRLLARLAYFACAAGALTIIAMITLVQPRWLESAPTIAPGRTAELFAVFALPFVFVGAAFAVSFRHSHVHASRISFAALFGASLGVVLALSSLRYAGPRAGLITAVVSAAAAILFWLAGSPRSEAGESSEEGRPSGAVVATIALGSAVLLAGDIGAPWLKILNLRFQRLDKAELQEWSPRSFLAVDRPAGGVALLQIDGAHASPILEAKKMPDPSPADLAFVLQKDQGPALVIGAGGGVDVRRALKAGHKAVHVAEPDGAIVSDVLRGKYRDFSGDVYGRAEVVVAVADGRRYVRDSQIAFRSILVSLPDSFSSASVGALSLTPSRLHTIEGLREIIERLDPSGTLLITRLESELDRLIALGAASLRALGAASPRDHLFACSQERAASLLIKRAPLTRDEIAALRSFCRKSRFAEAFAPDVVRDSVRRRVASSADVDAAAPLHPTDLSPPTDDRPFFSYTTPLRSLASFVRDPRALAKDSQGTLALFALLAAALSLAFAVVFIPLVTRPSLFLRAEGRGARAVALIYFMCIGFGAVLAGASLTQHAASLVDEPTYGLAGSLVAILLTAAIGARLTAAADAQVAAQWAGRRAQFLAALFAVYAAFGGPLFRLGVNLPLAGRCAVAFALVAPAGALLGGLAPLGVRLVAARAPDLLEWCLSLHRAAGLLAVALGAAVALHLGWSAASLAAGLTFFVAAVAVPVDRRQPDLSSNASEETADLPPGFGPPPPLPVGDRPPVLPEFGPPAVIGSLVDDAPPTVRGPSIPSPEPPSELPATRPSAEGPEPARSDDHEPKA